MIQDGLALLATYPTALESPNATIVVIVFRQPFWEHSQFVIVPKAGQVFLVNYHVYMEIQLKMANVLVIHVIMTKDVNLCVPTTVTYVSKDNVNADLMDGEEHIAK